MSARTRRQKAALAAQSEGGDASPTRNGSIETPKRSKSATPDDDNDGVKENVYLFAPNIIGKELVLGRSSLRPR
jgi:CDP-diacylglycerol--inositol 3-phosphatidyltransferase